MNPVAPVTATVFPMGGDHSAAEPCPWRCFVYELSSMPSPFREEHKQFRKTVRKFAEKELVPYVEEWEKAEIFPNEVFKRAGELGVFGAHYPEEVGGGGGTSGSAS